ncbi:uncharacterized protein Z519_06266 [Cladophialophora bantiana CBS 173.52]|uniref:Uncharacterized protein n=1 Tax=Cladophialophora bantiana (strain ATCC 10958 / CBS 173.52 / CDC B-1940 / NIH 8579) TaxID=1442370 RepID=A0A0D2EUW8_CLAB1|nr:uncharacterized protein Z519_06266 [Cladophialophora bantiana CBS 173.52]KIW93661.1 hypothetical protein Z519_06266 [Cladophialophora bantiana CBS 173.52]
MATAWMKRRQLHDSNAFDFDPPTDASSSSNPGSGFDAPWAGLYLANTSTRGAPNTRSSCLTDMDDPFVLGDASRFYQFATENETDNVNTVTNGAGGSTLSSLLPDLQPDTIFDQLSDEEFASMLQIYVERGPSPSQGCDDNWYNMNATSNSVNESISNAAVSLVNSPGLAADTENTNHTPKTNVSAAQSTSPTTPGSPPGSACRTLLKKMSRSPIEIPDTPEFADFHHPEPSLQNKSRRGMKRNDGHPPNGAGSFSQSSPVRKNTPAKQVLGSPFKMPGHPASAPAKAMSSDNVLMNPLHSPNPAANRPRWVDILSPLGTTLPSHHTLTSSPMQDMADQTSRTISAHYQSPPNPTAFANDLIGSGSSGSFLDPGLPSEEQPSAKRARTGTLGAQDILANIAREEQMRHQTYFQHISQAAAQAGLTLANQFNDGFKHDFKWLERDRTDPEPPPSMVARFTGYEFPIPLPSGTMKSLEREAEEDVNVGQKRKAVHMTQDGIETNGVQDPFGPSGLGIAQAGPGFHSLFSPNNQGQSASHMQSQDRMTAQRQLQSPGNIQARGQSQGQAQAQLQMHSQIQDQGQLPQVLSNSRLSRAQQQQQQQGLQATPHLPLNGQQQLMRSTPGSARSRVPGTPTPASRRRSTLSRTSQNVTGGSVLPGSPWSSSQTPNGRSSRTPNNIRAHFQPSAQTSKQTPPIQSLAEMSLHLPTPQQPISTGSCPNTLSETLAETNRRTEAELRSLGAAVVDYDPNMSWDGMEDTPVATLYRDIGVLPPLEGPFGETIKLDVSAPPMLNMNMDVPQDESGNVAGLGCTALTTAVGAGNYAEGVVMTSPSNNNNTTDTPGNGVADISDMAANRTLETGAAVPAAADSGFPHDWTTAFDEGKIFDPRDFGL